MASTQHPSFLILFTLDITLLSRAGHVSIEKVLSRSKLEYLSVNCTPDGLSLTGLIAQVPNYASWSTLKALVVSGDNINEWLQLWPSIATPRLVFLEIRVAGQSWLAFLMESVDPSRLKRLWLGDTSDYRFKASGDAKDRYNPKFQTG
ncbi:hypothetical protein BG006_001840 [Podila minutissima]|uniref:Uncharacterized protein n=1 Tax=Podila minutissima TaxID=64525 RepID=A0A9P5SPM9_9FUNG|nr:hypothetical protein BG006_001840 [Podila minutissima]